MGQITNNALYQIPLNDIIKCPHFLIGLILEVRTEFKKIIAFFFLFVHWKQENLLRSDKCAVLNNGHLTNLKEEIFVELHPYKFIFYPQVI